MKRPPFDEGAEALTHYLWRHYGSHERPGVLYKWTARGLALDVVAELLPDVWTGRNEKMAQNLAPDEWEELFDAAMPGVEVAVPLTVYRAGHAGGMSWTTDRSVAEMFAERGDMIHQFTITDSRDVLAVFAEERNESEVVLRPGAALVTIL